MADRLVIRTNETDKDKILIIAPHPDDECIGVGGIISLYPQLCDVIVVTDGCRGSDVNLPEKERKIRKKQFEDEMEYVGIHSYQWLGYEDGTLMHHEECTDDIDVKGYTKIFLPWYNDDHPDHAATYLYAMKKIRQEQLTNVEIFQYEVHVPFHNFTHYVDITNVVNTKKKLISFHKDQMDMHDYAPMHEALNRYRACQLGEIEKSFETYTFVDMNKSCNEKFFEREKALQRQQQVNEFLYDWLKTKILGREIHQYCNLHKFFRISVHGYAKFGKLICEELKNSDVVIVNILDRRNLKSNIENIPVVLPQNGDISVDAVIVTSLFHFKEINVELKALGYQNIIHLKSIVNEIMHQ